MSSKGGFSGCTWGALKLSFVTLGVVLFIGFLTYEESTAEEKAAEEIERRAEFDRNMNTPFVVANRCGRRVKKALKDPSTYKFGSVTDAFYKPESKGVRVIFSYTATNSFGARITEKAGCETVLNPSDNKWSIQNLKSLSN